MPERSEKKYSGWRAALWPIEKYELKKVIPMSLLLFCMLYDYTSVRMLKDMFIVTTRGSGASVIPFLKSWLVLPSAILFVALYAKMSAKFSKKTVFYSITTFFAAFFFIFGNIMFPWRELLHMSSDRMQELQALYPRFSQLIAMSGLWTFSIFYVFAELWGNIGITVLFWQFANQITPTSDAKRHYVSFQSIGNFALIAAALLMRYLFPISMKVPSNGSVQMACNWVAGLAVMAMVLYWYINKYVMTDPRFPMPVNKADKTKKKKPGLMESFKIILRSKYLSYIALLVIAYGVSINFVEVTWKDMMKNYVEENPTVNYMSLQAVAFMWTGIASIVIATFGKGIVQRFGWRLTALVTPIGMLVTSLLFFGAILMPAVTKTIASSFSLSILGFGVFIGVLQQVFTKSAKYVLFDSTKEMAYIPLEESLKVQGKAAVEVFAGRAGKSLGGFLQSAMIFAIGVKDMFALTPYLAIGSTIIVLIWIAVVNKLSVEYNAKATEEVVK